MLLLVLDLITERSITVMATMGNKKTTERVALLCSLRKLLRRHGSKESMEAFEQQIRKEEAKGISVVKSGE